MTATASLAMAYGSVAIGHATLAASVTVFTSQTPAQAASTDPDSVELGMKFRSSVPGTVIGIRFYKGTGNGGAHVGNLWSSAGARLATGTFSNESASGWQSLFFATAPSIQANTTYVASYFAPQGHYAFTSGGLSSTITHAPLSAPSSGSSSGNDVFAYSSASAFPTQTYNAANYWVDVIFRPASPDPAHSIFLPGSAPMEMDSTDGSSVEVGVRFTTDTAGVVNGIRYYRGTTGNGGTHVGNLWNASGTKLASATFSSTDATGWQEAKFTTPAAITPGQTYTASYFAPQGHYSDTPGGLTAAVNNAPLHTIAGKNSSGASVNGVYRYSASSAFPTSSYLGTNYWVDVDFTPTGPAPAPSAPRAGVNGSGPILVLTDPDNHFTDYLGVILNSEGIHEFASTDAANLGNTVQLSNYSEVVVGDEALTNAQVGLLTTWVSSGGTLVAMHPRANLDGLLGLQPSAGVLDDGYIAVDGSQAPGKGITTSTMQYHGSADEELPTNDARVVATLYSTATTATPYAAVTDRVLGNGQSLAFTYDLARSVVYTRQGNPAWQGQNRDASYGTISNSRSDDQFFGNASYDPEPDYVDLSKALIPQADEQQRLLANALTMAAPLPRLNYLPNGLSAVVVMTGDGHPGDVAADRFDEYLAQEPPNCSVANWTCYLYTGYIYVGGLTSAQLISYQADGFEIALHVNTGCVDYNPFTLDSDFFTPQLAQFRQSYPGANQPITSRTHCITWSDYSTQAAVESAHGIRYDVNYYYWPGGVTVPVNWTQQRPGYFTGSAMPQYFATADGVTIPTYQAATEMPDESGITDYTAFLNPMLDNAASKGYTATIVTNCHLDLQGGTSEDCALKALAAAKARNLPVITAAQDLRWLDARQASSVAGYTWDGATLGFVLGTPAANLQLMIPAQSGAKTLAAVTVNGTAAGFTTALIHGVNYALINSARAGTYAATYQ